MNVHSSLVLVVMLASGTAVAVESRSPAAEAAATAYRQLAPLQSQRAGDPDFDYALGTSALDSGRPGEAVYILQRVVALRPAFAGARMELARAYYALGDNEAARREFLELHAEDPPPDVAVVIADYLEAIDARAAAYRPQHRVTLEAAGGYDSNSNGAPDLQSFLGFTLDARNQAADSAYYGLGLGGTWAQPLRSRWKAVAEAQYRHRSYGDAPFVDSDALGVRGGFEWRPGATVVSLTPGVAWSYLGGAANHRVTAIDLAVAHHDDPSQVGVTARISQLRFAEALVLDLQEVDSTLVGLTAMSRWPKGFQLASALTLGEDTPVAATSPFGRSLRGARVTASLDIGGNTTVLLSGALLQSDYDGRFFGATRSDEQKSAALGLAWRPRRLRGWSVRAQLDWVDNQSDVALYRYERVDAGVTLRREFK